MNKLSDLPNIGKELEKILNELGINTKDDLLALGSIKTCKKLELSGMACYNKLYALEGAIQGIRWHQLPKDFREQLKKEYNSSVE